ncbi:hypothetical protein GWK47_042887 [Chionoecetes opilio]|uniref:Uncharacterized protein n=1 Tax=Chionoecetes opilio TaxID=41210 RepID=A0A8J5CW66_CHIOP|nr:hypothetical protein GWK47_042887 [Chionoecetes opilio]
MMIHIVAIHCDNTPRVYMKQQRGDPSLCNPGSGPREEQNNSATGRRWMKPLKENFNEHEYLSQPGVVRRNKSGKGTTWGDGEAMRGMRYGTRRGWAVMCVTSARGRSEVSRRKSPSAQVSLKADDSQRDKRRGSVASVRPKGLTAAEEDSCVSDAATGNGGDRRRRKGGRPPPAASHFHLFSSTGSFVASCFTASDFPQNMSGN